MGEVCPIPHYLPAYAGGIAPAMEEVWPVLCGADPVGPEAVMAKANGWLIGHEYAKSALDIALWDITGKVANMPLYTLLGGRRQADMPLYHSITCIAPEEMVKIARDAQAKGMTQFQVKLGADNNWEADVARLRMVREEVGSGPLVYGDWNCGRHHWMRSVLGARSKIWTSCWNNPARRWKTASGSRMQRICR